MKIYILKRISGFLIVFIGVTVLAFVLSSISNQDPAFTIAKGLTINPTEEFVESIREEFNLDKPLVLRYFSWLGRAALLFTAVWIFSNKITRNEVSCKTPPFCTKALNSEEL